MYTAKTYAECAGCGVRLKEYLNHPLSSRDPDIIREILKFIEEHKEHGKIFVDTF